METLDLFTIASIALIGSFGHCIGMCGGIVIAYTSVKIDDRFSKLAELMAHLSYSFGRITTYVFMGAIFGYVGKVFTLSPMGIGILFFIAGIFMILTGLALLGKIKSLIHIEHLISNTSWYKNTIRKLLHTKKLHSFYTLGVLNGFLPCGFVYFFAVAAAATASPTNGAIVMLVFGLCTIPGLLFVGFVSNFLKKMKYKNILMTIASVLVIAYGVITLVKSYKFATNQKSFTQHMKKIN